VADAKAGFPFQRLTESIGRHTVAGIQSIGYAAALFFESLYWLVLGPRHRQPVHPAAIVIEMMKIGIRAIPIIAVLSMSVGVMIAIQGIYTLREFGAEPRVVDAIAMSITREFAALITAFLVAGRSGSAITAQIGTMQINQEIDALKVMGISPVRYLVAPVLLAMLVMLPCLTILADFMGILGGSLFCAFEIQMDIAVYMERTLGVISAHDISQGLYKSLVFAVLITLIGVINGFQVRGGAEGIGRATTHSVVVCISAIIVADMIFTYFLSR
jgi:phospholipid/cholesterol/gamma-HCH transport system permease protein